MWTVYEWPETTEEDKGKYLEHFPEEADIQTIRGAKTFFCQITGWKAKDLVPFYDENKWPEEDSHIGFWHKKLGGLIGGMEVK